MKTTSLSPIKTPRLNVPQDDLFAALIPNLPQLQNGDILCISAKVVAIHQGRCIKIDGSESQKDALIEQESDSALPRTCSQYNVKISLCHHAIMPSAGIDESNANGHYILLPEKPFAEAQKIHAKLCAHFNLTDLGIIIADSHTTPMRWGTLGISMGFHGFNPLRDYRGKADLYGRPLEFSQSNIADSIAAAAVGIMGEGDECTPAVLIQNWPNVEFSTESFEEIFTIDPQDDLYAPLLEKFST